MRNQSIKLLPAILLALVILFSSASEALVQSALQYSTMDSYDTIVWLDIITMAEGAAGCMMLDWRIPAEADNRIQGDSATVQFVITLAPVEYKSKRLR